MKIPPVENLSYSRQSVKLLQFLSFFFFQDDYLSDQEGIELDHDNDGDDDEMDELTLSFNDVEV